LSSIADVKINAQAPYIRSIEAADDMYIPGDTIVFTAQFSEAVMVHGGAPSLVFLTERARFTKAVMALVNWFLLIMCRLRRRVVSILT